MHLSTITLLISLSLKITSNFVASYSNVISSNRFSSRKGYFQISSTQEFVETPVIQQEFDYHSIKSLTFRQLQKECNNRGLDSDGNTGVLRKRLMDDSGIVIYCEGDDTEEEECIVSNDIEFIDISDKDFDSKDLLQQVMDKASIGHWKSATRKLKQYRRKYSSIDTPVPEQAYISVLESCVKHRLQGARASEPSRKILEEMVESGYTIPEIIGNNCIISSLGDGPNATHDGHGGIDVALAMLSALECTSTEVNLDARASIAIALAQEGSTDEAVAFLRSIIVDHSLIPTLAHFADIAHACAKAGDKAQNVIQVLTLLKASGYEFEKIVSAETGRSILASGVIAAEQLDNVALGLRFFSIAQKAEGCAPDRGDDLIASSSSAAQRAATLIHKRAIDKAVTANEWKLAVKLLELMPQRSLMPASSVWRKVVTVCAKCEKSRKATAILIDWVKLYEEGKLNKPPLLVFNTVVNACEICKEEELTVLVLNLMKKTHLDGNVVTFNIALKRLAKLGNTRACEGIIVSMISNGIEPNVVSYTTAIGACAKEGNKDSALAKEWLHRMRSRNVKPNFHTYNTALAACLEGTPESITRGSEIATMMLLDAESELTTGFEGSADYNSVIPDSYTIYLTGELIKQSNRRILETKIDTSGLLKDTTCLLKLFDFHKNNPIKRTSKETKPNQSNLQTDTEVERDEILIDYAVVNRLHKDGRRNIEV